MIDECLANDVACRGLFEKGLTVEVSAPDACGIFYACLPFY